MDYDNDHFRLGQMGDRRSRRVRTFLKNACRQQSLEAGMTMVLLLTMMILMMIVMNLMMMMIAATVALLSVVVVIQVTVLMLMLY